MIDADVFWFLLIASFGLFYISLFLELPNGKKPASEGLDYIIELLCVCV